MKSKEYLEGLAAFNPNVDKFGESLNPHKLNSSERIDWHEGWLEAYNAWLNEQCTVKYEPRRG